MPNITCRMRFRECLVVAVVLLQFLVNSNAQDCLLASNGTVNLPSFSNQGQSSPRIEVNPIQAIITSYKFQCCGVITGWAAFVNPGGGNYDGVYSISFQVWRPMLSDGDRYVKVGENYFESVKLNPSSVIDVTPASNQRLHFQPGDVVGYYLEQNQRGNDGGLQFDESFSQETLWYATGNTDLRNASALQVGSNGNLSTFKNLGPIISVSFTISTLTLSPSSTRSVPSISVQKTSEATIQVTSISVQGSSEATIKVPSISVQRSSEATIKVFSTPTPSSSTRSVPSISVQASSESTIHAGIQSTKVMNVMPTARTLLPSTDPPLVTDTQIPGSVENNSIGLIVVIVILIGLLVLLAIVVLIVSVVKKRRSKRERKSTEVVYYSVIRQACDIIDQEHFYESMREYLLTGSNAEPPTSRNMAYNQMDVVNFTTSSGDPYTTTNRAYGTGDAITSRSTTTEDYYVNEGLQNPASSKIQKNTEYVDIIFGQSFSSGVTGSLNDTSIPTKRNEACSGVSTNTERVDTE